MDIQTFVNNYISNINSINESNIIKYEYQLKDKLEKKETKEIKSYKEMKLFTDSRKKFYMNQSNSDDNLNIFENSLIKTDEKIIDFYDLEPELKLEHIKDFIKRKKYKLACDLSIIDHLLVDNDLLKKYITIDKTFNIINKVSFLKKMENGDYNIILNNKNSIKRTKKNFFK